MLEKILKKIDQKLICEHNGRMIKQELKSYINGEVKFETVAGLVRDQKIRIDFDMYSMMWSVSSDHSARMLRFMYEIKARNNIFPGMYIYLDQKRGSTIEDYVDFAIESGVRTRDLFEFFAINGFMYQDKVIYHEGIRHIARNDDTLISKMQDIGAKERAFVINCLYGGGDVPERCIEDSIRLLSDGAKAVREMIVKKLSELTYIQFSKHINVVEEVSKSGKKTARESVTSMLGAFRNEDEVIKILSQMLEGEKDIKVRDMLTECLEIDVKAMFTGDGQKFDVIEYAKSLIDPKKKYKVNIPLENFTKIRWKESGEYVEEELIRYFVKSYMESSEFKINNDVILLSQHMVKSDLTAFSNEILDYWIEGGFKAKEKYSCLLASVHGDYELVKRLEKLTLRLSSGSKRKMASYVVNALAFNGSKQALTIVDSIAGKYRCKSVKENASKAFQLVAKETGCSVGELQDRIVPDLGFCGSGYREYDYGERKFKVIINDKLELSVLRDGKKALKSLPKVNASDDEEKANAAREDFKVLKKELKDAVKSQTERMERALSGFRTWSAGSWKALFIENPIMNRLARSILWGMYDGSRLVRSFVYDDGFYDFEDEQIELDENLRISIVHPLELDESQRGSWRGFFDDHEIAQPFEQIERSVFICENRKIKTIKDFKTKEINDRTLMDRLIKKGWNKGATVDVGGYIDFYIENIEMGVAAEITIDHPIGVYSFGDLQTKIETVEFYKAVSIDRSGNSYDKIDRERRIRPFDVSKRFYSEVIYQINEVLK